MAIFHSTVRILSTFFLVYPAQAWTNIARTGLSSCDHHVLNVNAAPASVAAPPHPDNTLRQDSHHSNAIDDPDARDAELLCAAMETAREADRRYGLCTPASTRAWKIVDELYSSSLTSRQVEDNVKEVFGYEKSVWSSFERDRRVWSSSHGFILP